jgi:predicted nucleic acid-binding protein
MAIVLDINVLSRVFDESNQEHSEFKPVKDWIESRKGVAVFGGSKYKEELSKTYKYLKLILELKKQNKAVAINDEKVDAWEGVVKSRAGEECDDAHVIALMGVSRCSLLCSFDRRSFFFVKDRHLYPDGASPPGIYSGRRNKDLLRQARIQDLRNVVN